ncbi:unnamed protein product [Urochloa decumbens]|uniref:DUF1618 domain-containing protein n=1 Tax=Urochloa decumbens TaxID=240449 RepID=A0ABC8VET9_9POAL
MATAVAAASRSLIVPPASPAAPPIRAGWTLFDPFVVTEDAAAAVTNDDTAATCCVTRCGRDVRVSLRLADPPSASYVVMRTDAELHGTPKVVAADGDLLLIEMAVVEPPSTVSREQNFLVYTAHPSSPSLLLLPHRDDDSYFYTGIVAGEEEEEEFVAAAFSTEITRAGDGDDEGAKEVGWLTRFSSSTGQHEVLDLPIPYDPSKGLYKLVWHTDKVFAFRGRHMCFVDYHRGILLCDVFTTNTSPELRFLPLPEIEVWDEEHDYFNGRRLPQEHRTVDVSKGGVMRFVDVSDGLFGRRRHPYAVTVTTWTLRAAAAAEVAVWEWEKDGVLQVGDLWNSCEFRRSPLPRRAPLFPAVCKRDPGVVGFALMDWNSSTKDAWVIVVDVREMELLAYAPYTNQAKEGEVHEEGYEVVAGCLFHDTPFICSDIYNYYKTFARMEDAGRQQ